MQLCYSLTPEMKETLKMANNCRVTQQKTAAEYGNSREGCYLTCVQYHHTEGFIYWKCHSDIVILKCV